MKASKKANLLIMGMSLLTAIGVMGSTMGTLSWYAYSTHTTLSYTGTSVRKSVLLNIGIVDENGNISADTIAEHHLIRDENNIVWTSSSTGLSELVIKDYLDDTDYAYNELSPVTSNERAIDATTDITLYESPEHGKTAITDLANKKGYVKIPFAFKIVNNDNVLVKNQDIWLTDVDVQTSENKNLEHAVRVFVNNKTASNNYLLKPYHDPSDTSTETGSTKVGGLLDLNGDEIYDYNIEDSSKEYIYGHYTGTPTYTEPTGSDSDFDNFNDTPYTKEASTFYAKHRGYARTLNKNSVTFLEAHYETFNTVKPTMQGDGTYTGGKPVAHTSSDTGIGYTDLTIYLEGWDHAIINTAAGCSFNLGLTFEINKI